VILPRHKVLRWGFKLGILVAWISDSDQGYDRRRVILDNLDRVIGPTRAAPLVDMLSALNDKEFDAFLELLPRPARHVEEADLEPDEDLEPVDEFEPEAEYDEEPEAEYDEEPEVEYEDEPEEVEPRRRTRVG
jgi:hypothetical protein